jgi:AcrR family transcriptional regulator
MTDLKGNRRRRTPKRFSNGDNVDGRRAEGLAPRHVVNLRPLRNQAGRPTQQDIDRRKRHVIEVAMNLFLTRGYLGVSLVQIAKNAGVATRTVYQHFGNKETLFRTVISARELSPMNERPDLRNVETLFELLMRLAHYVSDVALNGRSVSLMRLIIAEAQRFPEITKKVADAGLNSLLNTLSQVFDQLEKASAIPGDDHALTARLFIDLILGFGPLRRYANWEANFPAEEELESKVSLFVLGRFGPEVAKMAKKRKRYILRSDSGQRCHDETALDELARGGPT